MHKATHSICELKTTSCPLRDKLAVLGTVTLHRTVAELSGAPAALLSVSPLLPTVTFLSTELELMLS